MLIPGTPLHRQAARGEFELPGPEELLAETRDILAGLELPFGHTWSLMFEGRYSWSEASPGGPFEGLGELDLGGFAAYVGASWRF